ncbi:hypothetical protein GCM10009414_08700 [Tatumella terrea]
MASGQRSESALTEKGELTLNTVRAEYRYNFRATTGECIDREGRRLTLNATATAQTPVVRSQVCDPHGA